MATTILSRRGSSRLGHVPGCGCAALVGPDGYSYYLEAGDSEAGFDFWGAVWSGIATGYNGVADFGNDIYKHPLEAAGIGAGAAAAGAVCVFGGCEAAAGVAAVGDLADVTPGPKRFWILQSLMPAAKRPLAR